MLKISKRKTATINFSFAAFSAVVNIINGIILLPIYIKNVGSVGYGIWLACSGVVGLINIAEFGLATVLTQKFSKHISEENYSDLKLLTGSGLIITVIIVIIMAMASIILILFFPYTLKEQILNIHTIKTTILYAAIGTIGMKTSSIFGSFCQALQKTTVQNIILIIGIIINIISILISQIVFNLDFVSFGIGFGLMGITVFLMNSFLVIFFYNKVQIGRPKFEWNYTKNIIISTSGLGVMNISNVVINNLQAPIVAIFISAEVAAILNISGKIIKLCGAVIGSIMSSAYAGIVHILNSSKNENEILKELSLILSYVSAILFGVALLATKSYVVNWVGEDLYGGMLLIVLIYLGELIKVRTEYFATIFLSKGDFKKLSFFKLYEMIINLILVIILLPVIKLYGLPTSYLLGGIFLLYVLNKVNFKKALKIKGQFRTSFILQIILTCVPLFLAEIFQNIVNTYYFILYLFIYTIISIIFSVLVDKYWKRVVFKNIFLILLKNRN